MGAKTLLTLEEFMALPEDCHKHELSEGELVVMTPPSSEHNIILDNIKTILSDYLRGKQLGRALPEAAYAFISDPETVRQPGLSFLSRSRIQKSKGYYQGAPELAIEVVSPSDLAADLDLKVKQYLAAGSHEVWTVYPQTRLVWIYRADGSAHKLSDSDTITFDLFPGWSGRVADFFDLDY